MAQKEIKTFVEESSASSEEPQVTKDKKYDMKPRYRIMRRIGTILRDPVGGVDWEGEENMYGKKEPNKFEPNRPQFDEKMYNDAVKAEENYRKSHGGHSRIGSILRDGYKEPEDKQEGAEQ